MKTLQELLQLALDQGASDLHIAPALPVQLRIDGELKPADDYVLTPEDSQKLCAESVSKEQWQTFENERELDFSFSHGTVCRFRGNLYYDKSHVAGAYRAIPFQIPDAREIGLPPVVVNLMRKPRGLVLVTGPTGSGKSTTLAALIETMNQQMHRHVLTIEDPIEFLYESKKCLINQREVGQDTHTFGDGLKHILRQDPDVVLIGEMRDIETIGAAITISETGHLVFATLHTNTAVQTINRIIDVFPPHQQPQVRTQLSFVLEAALSQKLIPKIGGGRVLGLEVMTPTYAIRNLIRENKIHQIYSSMITGQENTAMQTFNQSLVAHIRQGVVDQDVALQYTADPEELMKLLRGV